MILQIAIFDNLGTPELLLTAVVALLLFGKRLPEVASQAGATLAKFRRSLDTAIHDSGVEQEIRKIKSALPTDMSMRDVTRAAVRKFEDRVRDEVDPLKAQVGAVAGEALHGLTPSQSTEKSASETQSPAVETTGVPSANGQTAKPGVDPASQFGSSSANEVRAVEPNRTGQNGAERNGAASGGERSSRPDADAPSANATASTEAEAIAAERARQGGIPPRPLPPGSVPRD